MPAQWPCSCSGLHASPLSIRLPECSIFAKSNSDHGVPLTQTLRCSTLRQGWNPNPKLGLQAPAECLTCSLASRSSLPLHSPLDHTAWLWLQWARFIPTAEPPVNLPFLCLGCWSSGGWSSWCLRPKEILPLSGSLAQPYPKEIQGEPLKFQAATLSK